LHPDVIADVIADDTGMARVESKVVEGKAKPRGKFGWPIAELSFLRKTPRRLQRRWFRCAEMPSCGAS